MSQSASADASYRRKKPNTHCDVGHFEFTRSRTVYPFKDSSKIGDVGFKRDNKLENRRQNATEPATITNEQMMRVWVIIDGRDVNDGYRIRSAMA